MRKFKVELEIEINDNKMVEEGLSLNDYIEQELGWSSQSFEGLRVKEIKEILTP